MKELDFELDDILLENSLVVHGLVGQKLKVAFMMVKEGEETEVVYSEGEVKEVLFVQDLHNGAHITAGVIVLTKHLVTGKPMYMPVDYASGVAIVKGLDKTLRQAQDIYIKEMNSYNDMFELLDLMPWENYCVRHSAGKPVINDTEILKQYAE